MHISKSLSSNFGFRASLRNAAFIDDNGKATNSPNYKYRLTDEMLLLVKTFQSNQWEEKIIF